MKLFTKHEIESLVIFDIETTSGTHFVSDMPQNMQDIWVKRAEWLRNQHEDNKEKTDEEIYFNKAGLQAEFGKIVCISISYVRFDGNTPTIKTKSYASDNEKELLSAFFNFAHQIPGKITNAKLCGHAITNFDIPYVFKRGLINGLEVPDIFVAHNKKQWELPYVDTIKIWGNGSWKESFTSLEIITNALGIESPKDDIDGSEVNSVYWLENDLERIVTYCEKDVIASAQLILKLSGLDLATPENIIHL